VRKIVLWKGHHDGEFAPLVSSALAGEILLIACPPVVENFRFLDLLPEGEIALAGDWAGVAVPARSASAFYPLRPCLGVFTSATTEQAKLVLYTRENVESCARAIYGLFDLSRVREVFCYPQPFHTFGLTLGYAAAALFGWRLRAPRGKYSRAHHEEWLASAGAGTLTLGTPTHFLDLRDALGGREAPASYAAIAGGARVERSLWLSLRDDLHIEAPSIGYGATEASPGVAHLAPGVEPREDGEVGTPLAHLKVTVDPLTGVTFEGASVCAAIVHEGRVEFPRSFTLPDLLRVREDGVFVFEGRAKFTLNRGGKKLLLEAIEKELAARFQVEALAFSVPDARLGEELGLLVRVSNEELRSRRDDLAEFLRARYGVNFSAAHFRAVTGFPRNENQKPCRKAALRELTVGTTAG
jgi:acyl-CoA synthetase (AMP-forming)/AMP-acid ligase II